jgi:hypothetical protein
MFARTTKNWTMKNVILSILLLSAPYVMYGQAPDYDDLKILFADGKYEKLVDKAVGYTEKDKTKKDPVPYVWLSRGLYKISLSGSSNPNFKNAYKDAIGAMASAFKNDKDGTKLVDHQEFIQEFQNSLAEMIGNELAAGDINKAAGWVAKYYKITKNPVGAKFLDAAAKYKKGDKSSASTLWKEGEAILLRTETIEEWSEADKIMLKIGIMQSAECLVAGKQLEKAKTLMDSIAKWFESEEDYKTKYSELFL